MSHIITNERKIIAGNSSLPGINQAINTGKANFTMSNASGE